MLADAIREVIAGFPVYRTYVDARGNVSERDRAYIQRSRRPRQAAQSEHPAHAVRLSAEILLLL